LSPPTSILEVDADQSYAVTTETAPWLTLVPEEISTRAPSSLSDFTLAKPARFTIHNNQAGFS